MMKAPRPIITRLMLAAMLLGSCFSHVLAVDPVETEWILDPSASDTIQFEVEIPWTSLALETVSLDGGDFTRITLPDAAATNQPGVPELPLIGKMLAVPFGVELELTVTPGKFHTKKLDDPVLPVPAQVMDWVMEPDTASSTEIQEIHLVYEPDQAYYQSDSVFPGSLGKIANEGIIRQQRVVGIVLYPVQYDPLNKELIIYESLEVRLSFSGQIQSTKQTSLPDSDVYETFFSQTLLNYESSKAWRLPVTQQDDLLPIQTLAGEISSLPWVPPDPAWRVKVREEGVYRLTYAELEQDGLDVDSLDPTTFQMYYQGQEISILVEGEADLSFDANDSILFYAEALEDKYTLDNVYWLTYGSSEGLRMQSRASENPVNYTEQHFSDLRFFELNNKYLSYVSGDDDYERFLWGDFYALGEDSESWSYSLNLNVLIPDPNITCSLELDLFGYSNLPQDHHAEVYINNTMVGELFWQGQYGAHLSAQFSADILRDDNELKITLPNDQGAFIDWIYVERFSLTYPSGFRAQNDSLKFNYEVDGGNRFDIEGFSTEELYLFDISDSRNPQYLTDFDVESAGDEFTLSFQEGVDVSGDHTYVAVGNEALKQAHEIEQDLSTLADPPGGADYLVITHADFLASAYQLAGHRESKGLRTAVIDVQDIYDQFGYGIVGKNPIQAFLSYAYQNWAAPEPSYVVLLGDGHYNPKGYNPSEYGALRESFIPPYLAYADPLLGETAADNRYVAIVGDDYLPDMMLGRLAVMTVDQANAFVDKIIDYESNPSTIDWQAPVLAVADNSDYGGNFPSISEFLLSSSLPEEYSVQRVYLGVTHSDISQAKTDIINAINNGKFLMNYIGHGATHLWADGVGLLAASDVAGLSNQGKYPIISAMTCKEGYYINPQLGDTYEALAEVITRAEDKGAIASWSPTGNSIATGHDIINRALFVAIFSDLVPTMGQATNQSLLDLWASGTYLDLADTYLLFGDPAMTIHLRSTADIYLPLILR